MTTKVSKVPKFPSQNKAAALYSPSSVVTGARDTITVDSNGRLEWLDTRQQARDDERADTILDDERNTVDRLRRRLVHRATEAMRQQDWKTASVVLECLQDMREAEQEP